MTRPVFFFEEPTLAAACPGEVLMLAGEEGRHAATVRRIGAGEGIDLVDGEGTRAICEVVCTDKQGLTARVLDLVVEAEPSPRLVLVQALAKGGRDERAVEICTEIGVDGLVPWQSDRAIVRWAGPKAAKGRAKWEGVVRAAAKQARRARIPVVEDLLDTRGLVSWTASLIAEGGRVLVCHEEATSTLGAILAERPLTGLPAGARVAILVGPEGGISPEEISALLEAGAEPVGLGHNVLRSSTAGSVCATLLCAAAGRM